MGVDFSGARLAGRTTWIARCDVTPRARVRAGEPPLRLVELDALERLAGTADRDGALAHLVALVRASRGALWAIDAPFGLPVEVLDAGTSWADLVRFLGRWEEGAYALGLWALERGRRVREVSGGTMHVRRATDTAVRAPFDPYHYRIIYQTFFGMRDVIGRLAMTPRTAVLPFQYRRLPTARRVLVESCPGSLLKKLGLPHQNYKQPAGGPLTRKRLRTRHTILATLEKLVRIGDRERRVMMRNPGGDAMDAVIAAVGAARAVAAADHARIARHPRYTREGHLYV